MTFFDIAVMGIGAGFTGVAYLYLLNERRKLLNARNTRHAQPDQAPAE